MGRIFAVLISVMMLFIVSSTTNINVYANPFFENGYFTANGIEWCQENRPLYDVLGEKFFEHHSHSIESRVCANLYGDPLWDYDGPGRMQKLMERSIHYSQLEISESISESQTGIIDTNPASRSEIILRGVTEDRQVTVQLAATEPAANIPMRIDISFLDADNSLISDVTYSLEAIQDDTQVMLSKDGYSEKGITTVLTHPLQSDRPVDISVIVKSIGLPEDLQQYQVFSEGQVIMFTVVPEFGILAMMVLVISIMSVVIMSRRFMPYL